MNRTSAPFMICAILLLAGCKSKPELKIPYHDLNGRIDGHSWEVTYVGDSTDYSRSIDSIFNQVNGLFSLNDPGSVISRYNLFDRTDTLFCFQDPGHLFASVYDMSKEIQRKSGGYFDPTIYPVKRAWQILGKISADAEPDLDSLFAFVGYDTRVDMIEKMEGGYQYVETQLRKADARIELDYGSYPYAYGMDLVDNYMRDRGVQKYRIRLDQTVLSRETIADTLSTHHLGITDTLAINGNNLALSVVTAADKQFLIDPTYGYPVDNSVIYIAVLAPDAARAQAYAQAFLIMGVDAIGTFYENNPEEPVDAFVVFQVDGQNFTASTPGFDTAFIKRQSENDEPVE